VIAAGIRRVVCSMAGSESAGCGSGICQAARAGITVQVGLFEAEAKKLNESFAKYIRQGKPLVTLKSAMTLDGKIADATKPGTEPEARSATPATEGARSGYHWITGEVARAHVQQLRHQSDAILAGVGTVMADDPLLTDRSGLPRRRKLLRVILDSYLRIPPGIAGDSNCRERCSGAMFDGGRTSQAGARSEGDSRAANIGHGGRTARLCGDC
jgi:diaminohydroxyphosphoribosylaminopyrimidine deaminase / 5-amino-6-(5-phosphoribosylamino)uracil reductase